MFSSLKKSATLIRSYRSFSTAQNSFHKRILPASLVALSSPSGKQLFREALQLGGLESYFPLSEQFVTQSDPSYCSLSSLAMVLNALNFDPKKIWKGAWRWVSEETLQCETKAICGHSLERIRNEGLSFNDFESLAQCHGVSIKSHRANEVENHPADIDTASYNYFKSHVIETCSSDKASTFIVVNYSRKSLGQTGIGHFSPIGGYHAEKELVLILDVARFKYPPYWVPIRDLWTSMSLTDDHTGKPRGYFIISGAATSRIADTEKSVTAGTSTCGTTDAHDHSHSHEHSHDHSTHKCGHDDHHAHSHAAAAVATHSN